MIARPHMKVILFFSENFSQRNFFNFKKSALLAFVVSSILVFCLCEVVVWGVCSECTRFNLFEWILCNLSSHNFLINRLYTGLYIGVHGFTQQAREYFGQVSSLIYEPVKWLSLNINEMYTVMMMENTKRVETKLSKCILYATFSF